MLLDSDVAWLYGVDTREVNQAVKNNPEKFPEGYTFTVQSSEKHELVKNFDRFGNLKHSSVFPKAFTEKGLYMLATISSFEINLLSTVKIKHTIKREVK